MGDPAYVELFCRPQDRATFEKLGMVFQEEHETLGCLLTVGEGYVDDFPEDVPYYGYHGHGQEYDARAFACNGRKRYDVRCTRTGDAALVWCGPKGPDKQDVRDAERYWKAKQRAEELLERAMMTRALEKAKQAAS